MTMVKYYIINAFSMFLLASADLLPFTAKSGTLCLDCQETPQANLVCLANERIAFKGIFYGAKRTDNSCQKGTKFKCNGATPSCCLPDIKTDCVIQTVKDYYTPCTGRQTCSITFSDDTMTCPKSPAITKPNYAGISYYCIPEAQFLKVEGNSKLSGTTVYLINTNYPAAMSAFSTIRCSMETECGKKIKLVALDVYLTHEKDAGCQQIIQLKDETTLVGKDCFTNNNFRTEEYHVSKANFMTFTITNQRKGKGGSFVWLAVMESTFTAEVAVTCGKNAAKTAKSCTARSINEVTVLNQDNPTTTTTTTTTNSTPEEPVTGQSASTVADDSQAKIISITLIMILLVAIGVGFGIYFYKKKHQTKVLPGEDDEEECVSASTESILPKQQVVRSAPKAEEQNRDGVHKPSTSRGDSRRSDRLSIPPLPEFPALPNRHGGRVLPSLGITPPTQTAPPATEIPRRPTRRKILPKIGSRLPKLRDSDDDD
ncbi:hypothetical protein SNE40_023071 [Patella caerulea]|uniref:Uncharacterized protein n=1 Tax=Patella caerulea TaxID=87958 RepID=A0AAN8IY98_PATCE